MSSPSLLEELFSADSAVRNAKKPRTSSQLREILGQPALPCPVCSSPVLAVLHAGEVVCPECGVEAEYGDAVAVDVTVDVEMLQHQRPLAERCGTAGGPSDCRDRDGGLPPTPKAPAQRKPPTPSAHRDIAFLVIIVLEDQLLPDGTIGKRPILREIAQEARRRDFEAEHGPEYQSAALRRFWGKWRGLWTVSFRRMPVELRGRKDGGWLECKQVPRDMLAEEWFEMLPEGESL